MFWLYTDFGAAGPYVGQMQAVLARACPDVPAVTLMADAPRWNPRAAAYLLAALTRDLPPGDVVLGVVDPGVGTRRRTCAVEADGRWFVGPDNGLFALVARQAARVRVRGLPVPAGASATFHGRDVFAPVAARIAAGVIPEGPDLPAAALVGADWPDDLDEIVYVDPYGNAISGRRAVTLPERSWLEVAGVRLDRVRTYSEVAPGRACWCTGSSGLVEIAVNQGEASRQLGLEIGSVVRVVRGE